MNIKSLNIIKNFTYTLSSNLLSLIISTVVTLIIPRLIGVEEYGFWQLFVFYSGYMGVFHLGWNDGIYLRYGGKDYNSLNKKKFFSQFLQLLVLETFFAIIIIIFASFFADGPDRTFIFQMLAVDMIIMNVRYYFMFILQATNRISSYATIMMMDRILFISIIMLLILSGSRDYHIMIVADLLSKLISLIYAIYICKDIVFLKISEFFFDLKESFENINVGSKLLLANLSSNAIIGIVRFGIERMWDVETFGRVSLTLSISHFMMVFINGVGIVVYPILRRTNEERRSEIYLLMRNLLMTVSFAILIFYYPGRLILSLWLPDYADSLLYMSLLFPIVVFEGRITLIINPYFKALRLEKTMLNINIISVIISAVFTVITAVLLHNLNLAVLTIMLGQMFRTLISENVLSRELKINLKKDLFLEILLTLVFIISGWYIDSWLTMIVYSLSYTIYLIINRIEIFSSFSSIKQLVKNDN